MRRFDREWGRLVAARPWLRERGYRLVETRGPEGMDQGFDIYRGPRLELSITADRSQWYVEIAPAPEGFDTPGTNSFDLESWSACLGAPVLFHDTRPTDSEAAWLEVIQNSWWLEPQLDFLQSHLGEIERACEEGRVRATLDCLTAARDRTAPFPSRSVRRNG